MAKKVSSDSTTLEIKRAAENKKIKIGFKEALKTVQEGTANKVFYATNLNTDRRDELVSKCSLAKVPCSELKFSNVDMGTSIKKPFSVAVVTLLKE